MNRTLLLGLTVALPIPAVAVPAAAEVPESSPVRDALLRADASVDRIVAIPDGQRTFDNTIVALDDVLAHLELDTNIPMFMAYVSTDRQQRADGEQAEQDVANWLIDLDKREDLYQALTSYTSRKPRLTPAQQRLLDFTMRDFRRAGMALPAEQRDKLKAVEKRITELGIQFERNIREDDTRVPLTRAELGGVPDGYFDSPSLERSGDIYLVGMSYPQFLPIMSYCDDATTREKVWLAYKRRGGHKNVEVIEEILQLRAQAAEMLDYANPADFETEIRMARDAATVQAFYQKLRPLVRRKALLDWQELLDAKCADTGDPDATLYPWDTDFYITRLKKTKYAVDTEKVREYFPVYQVVDGLFTITQHLYGIEYREVTETARRTGRPLWHDDVRLYEVWDTGTGELLGEFYIDLYPREGKYTHAAQWGLAQHKVWSDGDVTKPLAALVCNFPEPQPDRPSLLTHDDVETFFHEFGHCLHTILSESQYYRFGGTSVERDFVEAPSQMFENWVWDADVLRTFARHYDTGKPFPPGLLEGMLAARHLASGMLAERQFYYGLFDLGCHTAPGGKVDTTALARELWDPAGENVELYDPVPATFFQAAFGHLNGYQAGYYGYQWSLVYACDMFQRFKELGMLSPEAGLYYRQKILSRGGGADGLDMVRDYLGREPQMGAYLRHLGLEPDAAISHVGGAGAEGG